MSMRRWLRGLGLMLLWEATGMRFVLPFALVVQAFLGAGMAVGLGFFIGQMTETQALYLATGVSVTTMITIGMVLAPQIIAQQKAAGTYEYLFSLPVPRTAAIAASLVVHSAIAVPGMLFALLIAGWRYDLDFTVSPLIVPATALTLITAASIGFAMAHAIPDPTVTGLITQVLVFVILLFSPVQFPAERLPAWLATVHVALPFGHCANLVRAGLTEGLASGVERSFAVLLVWAVGSWALTAWVVGRRG